MVLKRMSSACAVLAAAATISYLSTASAVTPIPIETFAAKDSITDAAISPDGHYLAEVRFAHGRRVAVVLDRLKADATVQVVLSDIQQDGNYFDIDWCSWANNTRLICEYSGLVRSANFIIGVSRLAAVDPDGKNTKMLMQNSSQTSGDSLGTIIDWNPGKPDTVLMEARESLLDASSRSAVDAGSSSVYGRTESTYPAVFEVNIVTGQIRMAQHSVEPITTFVTDHHGNPRLGFGYKYGETNYQYLFLPPNMQSWRHLLQVEAFQPTDQLEPFYINNENTTQAYASGKYQGREALWSIDLEDKRAPQLIYSNSRVGISGPQFLKDGSLVGVAYETERPHMYYTDTAIRALMNAVDAALPDTFNTIRSTTTDRKLLVIRAESDTEPGAYYLFDTTASSLIPIGNANSGLDPARLGRMLSISYPARDGTPIPGYLTTPPGAEKKNLPLIVMPHGGPIARDSWEYFFLQQFLVNRGYAVLQMNFRGSDGYGDDWYRAAHQDWGGLTYDDIVDGARWAISSGIADPKRVAIVGWSFGGYATLLGAVRNSDLFRCAIDIAGVSDLSLLARDSSYYLSAAIRREQLGTNQDKLKNDSPRRHADGLQIPLLMIHGDLDAQVDVEHSRTMAAALKSAHKQYEYVEIKDATHQMSRESDRVTLLNAVEKFLNTNMPATVQVAASQ